MAQLPMYPAIANSPQTELAEAIDATQTTITVVDPSVLPAGPNLITINPGDETAETIRYAAIDGNQLTGCERGFQGLSAEWQTGTKLMRGYTAYDHDAFKGNIESHLNDKNNPHDTKTEQINRLQNNAFAEASPLTDYPVGYTTFYTNAGITDWPILGSDNNRGIVETVKTGQSQIGVQRITVITSAASSSVVAVYERSMNSLGDTAGWGAWHTSNLDLNNLPNIIINNFLRFTGDTTNSLAYIQAGTSNSDNNAELRITRRNSNLNLARLRIQADSAQINGADIWTSSNNPGSRGSSGYQTFASGVIMQYGSAVANNGDTITFPIAFPNATRVVVGSTSGSTSLAVNTGAYTNTSFVVNFDGSSSRSIRYIAFGD
ncbi:gp53-like domain-containing protein [Paenibacillus senegalensis]|uniref:gp53-like domain-containing protein n=1 Tax=Paenibacillus senegalensis TaxID=1465766 RepID=UPI0002883BA8|nr:hypothetical protein [Paenibacillus senegalensis]